MGKNQEQTGFEVAVIGMAGRFPGAQNIQEFWGNLIKGVESITFFTDAELEKAGVERELLSNPNYVRASGMVEQSDYFDANFFGYSPNDARALDPQTRLFSECVWEALEDAGYQPYSYKGLIGLYAGASPNYYWEALALSMNRGNLSEQFSHGSLIEKDFLTTRISHNLNLRGPSVSVSTACSTSLVAVHMACRGLLTGDCNIALAGGVSLNLPHPKGYLYQDGMIMSPDGHCRAFDAQAKGTVGGEGAGVVVLKLLRKAVADGDHIYAVIKGTAMNNDGFRKVGYTAPSIEGQADVIQTAQLISRVEPESVSYIETHGTGTTLGDPIEIEALKMAFHTDKKQFCYIGSVKTNIGHLDAAAGITSFIKTALALEHQQIPPSLHYQAPNPKIDFINSPFMVNDRPREWKNDLYPLRAGVSSFGIGGTNVHVVLEEAPSPVGAVREPPLRGTAPRAVAPPSWQLLLISAKTKTALNKATENLIAFLKENTAMNLADMAYTLSLGRASFPYRRMAICADTSDAAACLLKGNESSAHTEKIPHLVFLFNGQGAPCLKPGRELYENEPAFREEIDRLSEILAPLIHIDLRTVLYPNQPDERVADVESFTEFAVFSFEYALAKLLMSWGLKPQCMAGQGVGEYIAACLSGVFSLEEALTFLVWRGQILREFPGQATLDEPALQHFLKQISQIKFRPPQIPYLSNITGNWITVAEATNPEYWGRHLRNTQGLAAGLEKILDANKIIIIHISHGETLPSIIKNHSAYRPEEHLIFNSGITSGATGSDRYQLLTMAGELWLHGVPIDWEGFYRNQKRRRVSLPTYPFERQRFWIDGNPLQMEKLPSKSGAITKNKSADWFYLPSWEKAPLPVQGGPSTVKKDKMSCLVLLGDHRFAASLGSCLKANGIDPVMVEQGPDFQELGPDMYTINPGNEHDYETLFHQLTAKNDIPELILHLWNITDDPTTFLSNKRVRNDAFLDHGFYSLIYLAKAIAQEGVFQNLQIIVVANQMLKITDTELIVAEKAAILGPCKVIPQEYPGISCRAIDLLLPEPESIREKIMVENLVKELITPAPDPIIAYRGSQRWIQIFQPLPEPCLNWKDELTARPSDWLKDRGTYLITGGLGAIGMLMARHLAETVKANLILLGHSFFPAHEEWENWLATHEPNETICRKIRELKAFEGCGAKVSVFTDDLSSPEQLEVIVRQAEERFGTVNGVIHAAGVLGGKTIEDLTKPDCEKTFLPKIQGLLTLYQVFANRELDFCLLMSSLASILGGLGFAAYAAANLFMDAFTQTISPSSKTRWISVNWDGWDVSPNSDSSRTELGNLALTPEEGIAAFHQALEIDGADQVAVSTGSLAARIAKWIKLESLKQSPDLGNPEMSWSERPDISAPYLAPRNELESLLASIYQEVLGYQPVGVNDNFFELGGDSLKALTLIAKIQTDTQVGLTLNEFFRTPTVEELAAVITRQTPKAQFKGQAAQGIGEREMGLATAANLEHYETREKIMADIIPFNDVLYKDCLYNALFPMIYHFGRGIFPIIANDLYKYIDQALQNEVTIGIETLSARTITDIIGDLRLKVDYKISSENIVTDLIEAISNERPVCIMIDCYYEPFRRDTFQTIHWGHWLLVYGFNLTEQTFDIMEHSDLNNLDYRRRRIGFHDLIEAYQGCLTNIQKGDTSILTYYEFAADTAPTPFWEDQKHYQSIFCRHVEAHYEAMAQGLESLVRFREYFQALIVNETRIKKKATEVMLQFNEIAKAKLSEKYALEKLFGAGLEPLESLQAIIAHWNLIRSILDRYRVTGRFRFNSMQNAAGQLAEIIELEKDYLGRMKSFARNQIQ